MGSSAVPALMVSADSSQTRRKAQTLAQALQDAIDAQLPDTQRKADEMGLTMPDALDAHRASPHGAVQLLWRYCAVMLFSLVFPAN